MNLYAVRAIYSFEMAPVNCIACHLNSALFCCIWFCHWQQNDNDRWGAVWRLYRARAHHADGDDAVSGKRLFWYLFP